MSSLRVYQIFKHHVPENAIHYCLDLWTATPFFLKVSPARATKLGDFRYRKGEEMQTITINHNLNRYSFLVTYIHEVAHLKAFQDHGLRIAPHGQEWKQTFTTLMQPLLNDLIFPPDVLTVLSRHMRDPKASSQSDPRLAKALKKYDENPQEDALFLSDIPVGTSFKFRDRIFVKEGNKRTRAICFEPASGKKFLIPKIATIALSEI